MIATSTDASFPVPQADPPKKPLKMSTPSMGNRRLECS
jgi:hypothetical protein